MEISVLASGSKANCVYIEGDSGALLIDCGRSGRELLGSKTTQGRVRESGGQPDLIEGILVTHEHMDHVSGLGPVGNKLMKPVFGTVGTLNAFLKQRKSPTKFPVKTISYRSPFEVGEFIVEAFATSHDATEPAGFLISQGSTRVCYCTDTGVITERMMEMLACADGLILESNHCPDMLKNGPYPEFLKRRIASARGHLSNHDASEILRRLGEKIQMAILAHLSEENNEPDLAMATAQEALSFHSDSVEIFAASSVDRTDKVPIRKCQGKRREKCSDACWKYRFSL
jgi:phosphoribosyl 1,2-cyclic phosphodiesterase